MPIVTPAPKESTPTKPCDGLRSPVDGKDDSGTDKEGERVGIGIDLSVLSVEENSLDFEGLYSESGSGSLAGSDSLLSLSDLQSAAVMYSAEWSEAMHKRVQKESSPCCNRRTDYPLKAVITRLLFLCRPGR